MKEAHTHPTTVEPRGPKPMLASWIGGVDQRRILGLIRAG